MSRFLDSQCYYFPDLTLGHVTDFARLSEPSSVANSQDSSFNDSVASQASPPRTIFSDKPKISAANCSTRQITPPPSSSDPSSQERAAERLKTILSVEDDDDDDGRGQCRLNSHHAPNERPPSLCTDSLNGEPTQAHKRMADGQVKAADLYLPTSPADPTWSRGHSKNNSVASNSSQIGEVGSLFQDYNSSGSSLCRNSCRTISKPVCPTL